MSLYPFGAVRATERLGGLSNTTFKVVTEASTIVLRLYTPGHNPASHIALELEVLQHLSRKDFPAPRPLAGNNGELLQHWREYSLTTSQFIDGVSADMLPLTPSLCASTGALLARFQAAMRDFVPLTPERGGNAFAADEAMLADLIQNASAKGIAVDAKRLLAQWERAQQAFNAHPSKREMGFIHSDLWPPNVVCDSGKAVGLIDFENCCFAPTLNDFAVALLEFAMPRSSVLNVQHATAFVAGYLQAGGPVAPLEPARIVAAMEMACAQWVYWEVIELPALVEGETCLKRLALFDDSEKRCAFNESIAQVIARANQQTQV